MVLVVTTLLLDEPGDVEGAERLGSDVLELRLETLTVDQVAASIERAQRPTLATCRRQAEGGRAHLSPDERKTRLIEAIDAGTELVDVEHDAPFRDTIHEHALTHGTHVIVSHHDMEKTPTPSEGIDQLAAMQDPADILKLATTVNQPQDIEDLFRIANRAPTLGTPFTVMGIGDATVRAAAGPLGMALVYAAPGTAQVTGQLPTKLQTQLPRHPPPPEGFQDYVLLGHPVAHSLSPIMQNSAFAWINEGARYRLVDVEPDHLEQALHGLQAMGVAGGNATAPHKQGLHQLCDTLRPAAETCGAANSFRIDDDTIIGDNTDGTGALKALQAHNETLQNRSVLLIGAGGTANAAAHTFTQAGANVSIANRTPSKAKRLADTVGAKPLPLDADTIETQLPPDSIIFNATPVDPPIQDDTLARCTVFDATYGPGKAQMARRAELVGTRALDGLDLLIHQGDLALRFWLDRAADNDLLGVMSTAARTGELEMRYARGLPP